MRFFTTMLSRCSVTIFCCSKVILKLMQYRKMLIIFYGARSFPIFLRISHRKLRARDCKQSFLTHFKEKQNPSKQSSKVSMSMQEDIHAVLVLILRRGKITKKSFLTKFSIQRSELVELAVAVSLIPKYSNTVGCNPPRGTNHKRQSC